MQNKRKERSGERKRRKKKKKRGMKRSPKTKEKDIIIKIFERLKKEKDSVR